MPRCDLILNLPGFSIAKVSGYQPLLLDVVYTRLPRCGHCNSKSVRKKSAYVRTVAHELGHRRSVLRFKAYKLYCKSCQRYGNQQFPGINKHQRATWRAQAAVFHDHTRGVSQKDLAQQYKKGKATIERWYQRHYQEQNKELLIDLALLFLELMSISLVNEKGLLQPFVTLESIKYLM
ncbi:TnpA transposase [Legionella nautarum]|uniref:TnpA transposase n=1 Tax=Legionella nautarum TaxID=45070 RepID=A0A0W0X275_9GAMM|nr:TnpA transposase [Legionella nautarum]